MKLYSKQVLLLLSTTTGCTESKQVLHRPPSPVVPVVEKNTQEAWGQVVFTPTNDPLIWVSQNSQLQKLQLKMVLQHAPGVTPSQFEEEVVVLICAKMQQQEESNKSNSSSRILRSIYVVVCQRGKRALLFIDLFIYLFICLLINNDNNNKKKMDKEERNTNKGRIIRCFFLIN